MLYDKSDPASIQKMFGSIAKRYDRTNAVLSLGLHRFWNRALVHRVEAHSSNPLNWLDLCSGTGDIAYAYLKRQKTAKSATLVDFCPEMLACARHKAEKLKIKHALSFLKADVQDLPLANDSASVATMAYGIRNVNDPQKCFCEVFRVLSSGGVFGILELTQPAHPLLRWGHQLYLRKGLPLMGKWLTDNQEAYRYLCNSIQVFTPPSELEKMLMRAGSRAYHQR